MSDLIARKDVHSLIRELPKYAWTSPVCNEHRVTVDTDDVQFGVDKLPTITPESLVVHGRWEFGGMGWICSECEEYALYSREGIQVKSDYCPNCGCKMDLKE